MFRKKPTAKRSSSVPSSAAAADAAANGMAHSERRGRMRLHLFRMFLLLPAVLVVCAGVSGYLSVKGTADCSLDDGKVCRVSLWYPMSVQKRLVIDVDEDSEQRVGVREEWYPSGAPWLRGRYERGEKVGVWNEWWPNGARRFEGTYVRGKLQGPQSWWYADGHPEFVAEMKAGQRDGTEVWWHEGGAVRRIGQFVDGEKSGRFTVFRPDGKVAFAADHAPMAALHPVR